MKRVCNLLGFDRTQVEGSGIDHPRSPTFSPVGFGTFLSTGVEEAR